MLESFVERRQGPRVNVTSEGVTSERAVAFSVRVLDLGLNGVLVATSQPLEVGQYARLSTRLGDHGIEADVVIRRVSAEDGERGGYRVGARFVSLDEATRRTMQQFLAGGNHA